MVPSLRQSTCFLAASMAVLLGCSRCGGPDGEAEWFVEGVPHTVSDAKKLDDPPAVKVSVEKRAKSAGGGGSCHSAACVILLPALVGNALFPPELKLVTIQHGGQERFSGVYAPNGRFLSGVLTEPPHARRVSRIDSSVLDRSFVVETMRAPLGPGGKPGRFAFSSIEKQVPLLGEYERVSKEDTTKVAAAAIEALAWLGDDAVPLAEKAMVERDPQRELAKHLCAPSKTKPRLSSAGRERLVGTLGKQSKDTETARQALRCFRGTTPLPRRLAAPFAKLLIDAMCQGDSPSYEGNPLGDVSGREIDATFGAHRSEDPAKHELIVEHLARCSDEDARRAISWAAGRSLDAAELERGLTHGPRWSRAVIASRVDPNDASHYPIIIAALRHEAAPAGALLRPLADTSTPPSSGELAALLALLPHLTSEEHRALAMWRVVEAAKQPGLDSTPSEQEINAARSKLTRERPIAADAELSDITLTALGHQGHRQLLERWHQLSCAQSTPLPAAAPTSSARASASAEPPAPSASSSAGTVPSTTCRLPFRITRPFFAKDRAQLIQLVLERTGCSRRELRGALELLEAGEKLPAKICLQRELP